jgi:hypothetical protein
MKNTFKILIALIMIGGLGSCEGDDNFMIAEPQPAEFAILTPSSGSSIIITEETEQTNTAVTFSWEDVDYGTPTAVTYELQFAPNGTDFASPTVISSSAATNYSMTYAALQTAATALDQDPANEGPVAIDVRVKSTIGTTGAEEKYSDVVTISVTPFTAVITYPFRDLFLVGNATQDNWNNNSNNYALYRDPDNTDLYYYTGYFNAGEFKLLEKKGQWQPQWGQNGGVLAVNDGTGSDPGAFAVSSAGYYSLTVDLAANTYTLDSYDASGAATYSTVGIIGTATPNNWDAPDTDMIQSTFDPHIWYLNNQVLKAGGEMKFRANDAWDVNWGAANSYSGLATLNGPNIAIGIPADGNYDVWFNDITGRYVYIPVN